MYTYDIYLLQALNYTKPRWSRTLFANGEVSAGGMRWRREDETRKEGDKAGDNPNTPESRFKLTHRENSKSNTIPPQLQDEHEARSTTWGKENYDVCLTVFLSTEFLTSLAIHSPTLELLLFFFIICSDTWLVISNVDFGWFYSI